MAAGVAAVAAAAAAVAEVARAGKEVGAEGIGIEKATGATSRHGQRGTMARRPDSDLVDSKKKLSCVSERQKVVCFVRSHPTHQTTQSHLYTPRTWLAVQDLQRCF